MEYIFQMELELDGDQGTKLAPQRNFAVCRGCAENDDCLFDLGSFVHIDTALSFKGEC